MLVTPRTGVKDETNTVVNMPLPGHLATVCGIEVEEYGTRCPKASASRLP